MWVSSAIRLNVASVGSATIIRSYLGRVLKHYVNFSPKLNPDIPQRTCLLSLRQYNTNSDSYEHGDEYNDEKSESPYMYQKLSRKENAIRLMKCTGCSEPLAKAMLRDSSKIRYISSSEITRRIELLNENGISSETILKNYKILTFTIDELKKKIAVLDQLKVGSKDLAAPLLLMPNDRLRGTANWSHGIYSGNETKMSILCSKLKCDPAEIAYAATVHKFIQTVPFDRMIKILDLLLAEGVPPSNIIRDMWVVRYHVNQVTNRIKLARDGGAQEFKTWMVRCTEKILNTNVRRQSEKRELLGPHNDSAVDYISSRLKVTRAEAQLVFERQPQLRGVGAAKLCNAFDFLLGGEEKDSVGKNPDGNVFVGPKFDRIQIFSSSRILCHSLDMMKARLIRLRELGFEPNSPSILYRSKRKFEEFVRKLEEKQNALARRSGETIHLDADAEETQDARAKGV